MKKFQFKLIEKKSSETKQVYDVVRKNCVIMHYPDAHTIIMENGQVVYRPVIMDAFIKFLETK
jgi:hypothetical protein